jgi:hypothetical protein
MPVSIDKSRLLCFDLIHAGEEDIESITFNKITGDGKVKLKNQDAVITYQVMKAALKIGNSAAQATLGQGREVKEYIDFVASMREKVN